MRIKYNTEYKRWEVYDKEPRVRGGEPQPSFVGTLSACEEYRVKVEEFRYGAS